MIEFNYHIIDIFKDMSKSALYLSQGNAVRGLYVAFDLWQSNGLETV